jgi:hypothetical protein
MIFVLIAGSCTPFGLLVLHDTPAAVILLRSRHQTDLIPNGVMQRRDRTMTRSDEHPPPPCQVRAHPFRIVAAGASRPGLPLRLPQDPKQNPADGAFPVPAAAGSWERERRPVCSASHWRSPWTSPGECAPRRLGRMLLS